MMLNILFWAAIVACAMLRLAIAALAILCALDFFWDEE